MLASEGPGISDEAAAALDAAVARGLIEACYLRALAALSSPLTPQALDTVQRDLLRAADAGHPPALRALAIHLGRRPQPAAQARAMELLQQASEAGDPVAARLLLRRLRLGMASRSQNALADELAKALAASGYPELPEPGPVEVQDLTSEGLEPNLASDLILPEGRVLAAAPPRISIVPGLLSAEECAFMIAMAQPLLRPSQVHVALGSARREEIRTSSEAAFDFMQEDFSLRWLQVRMAKAAGCEFAQAEPLIVLHYLPGQQYRPHRDYLGPSALAAFRPEAGQRLRTVCLALTSVEAGGETDFPERGLRVKQQPGTALVFDNLDVNAKPAPESLHSGLPVERGEKWLATLWLRQHAFGRP